MSKRPISGVLTVVMLWSAGSVPAAEDGPAWATGRNVLVVYQSDDVDRDGNKIGESQDVAEYYARRRGVPGENLLGLPLRKDGVLQGRWDYRDFYHRILTPISKKLAGKTADDRPLREDVLYIMAVPNVPVWMETHHVAEPKSRDYFAKTHRRSVDQYLISIDANMKAGVDEKTGSPGRGRAGPLGSDRREVTLPVFGAYSRPARAKPFRQLRREQPGRFNFYLATRLGFDAKSARDMFDGALYAERYLRLPGPGEKAGLVPTIWLDQKYKFARDQVAAMSRAIAIVRGAPGTPFAIGKGLQRVWPLVIDNQLAEIGRVNGGSQHRPTVSATISANGVDEKGVTLEPTPRTSGGKDAPSMLYFPPGCRVTNGKAQARVIGGSVGKNRLFLDSTRGFSPGDKLTYTWPGRFPADNCFIFYGFYGLGQYEDVFKFPPGALGVHVDSSCMHWATGAIRRGIAATFGVTSEPLSAGIPYGDQMLLALSAGHCWADAVYGSLLLGQRWAGVTFGDPLYAPFRSCQLIDKTPPVFGKITAARGRPGEMRLWVRLGGTTEDELSDVALFKLEYGLTKDYGQCVDFFDWPEPEKSKNVKGRRFGYSRRFVTRVTGLEKDTVYHYRVTARDPAGLETRTGDRIFKP